MDVLMVVLRLIHVLAGVFWVGAGFHQVSFVTPAAAALGPDGQKFFQQLAFRSRFAATIMSAAVLTFLSGWYMYWKLSGFRLAWITSSYGLVLTVGAVLGTIAFIGAYQSQYRTIGKMKTLAGKMAAAGGPPAPEMMAAMQGHAALLTKSGQILVILLAVAVAAMATAQYLTFG